MKKTAVLLLLTAAIAIAAGVGYFKYQDRQAAIAVLAKTHAPTPSTIDLNEDQTRSVPALSDADRIPVFRLKTAGGTYAIVLKPEAKAEAPATALGFLHATPKAGEVDIPVYLCEYGQKDSGNTVLDAEPGCPGGGRLTGASAQKQPVGYVSKGIQTGYLLLARCSSSAGMYNTLNPRCESASDFWESNLGAIRAAKID